LNNLKQLGIALQAFQADFNYYPSYLDPSDHSENLYWKNALAYEIGIHTNTGYFPQGVWHCPAGKISLLRHLCGLRATGSTTPGPLGIRNDENRDPSLQAGKNCFISVKRR